MANCRGKAPKFALIINYLTYWPGETIKRKTNL